MKSNVRRWKRGLRGDKNDIKGLINLETCTSYNTEQTVSSNTNGRNFDSSGSLLTVIIPFPPSLTPPPPSIPHIQLFLHGFPSLGETSIVLLSSITR